LSAFAASTALPSIIPIDNQHSRECLPLKAHGRTIALTPKHEPRAGKMIVHLLTCLTLAALTSYVVALKLFDLGSVVMTADEEDHRVVAQAN
jgi:hypothetical protein